MKLIQTIKDERGFALVMALVVMAAMTAIGLAAVTSSTTDLLIARNEKEAKMAFYLAETGIEEAIARLSLEDTHARYIGETYTGATAGADNERMLRNQDWPTQPSAALELSDADHNFSSHGAGDELNIAALGGTYDVTVDYAREEDSGNTWCRGGNCGDNEIIVFCFEFIGGTAPDDCRYGFPVYEMTSVGTTTGGTSAKIVTYVSAAALNLLPPGDTILFTEGEIDAGNSMDGKVASWSDFIGTMEVVNCEYDEADDNKNCEDISDDVGDGPGSWIPTYNYDGAAADNEGAMIDYLGMSIDTIKSYADHSKPYPGNNPTTVSATDTDIAADGGFGTMCLEDNSDTGTPDFQNHICPNRPQILVFDNWDEANSESHGAIKTVGNETGRGLLIVTGDMNIGGTFMWEGMIFVMGKLSVSGNATIYGTIMVEGDRNVDAGPPDVKDVDVGGSLEIYGSRPVASSVAIGMSVPKMLRWTRL